MKDKIKLRHLGFVISVILLVSGWSTRLFGVLWFSDSSMLSLLDSIGIVLIKGSVFFFFGGILFYAMIAAKEQPEEAEEPLTEEQKKEKQAENLEALSYDVKNSIPFTAVYGTLSIILTLFMIYSLFFQKTKGSYFILGLLVGVFLSQYYIRKIIRQIQWLRHYKNSKE